MAYEQISRLPELGVLALLHCAYITLSLELNSAMHNAHQGKGKTDCTRQLLALQSCILKVYGLPRTLAVRCESQIFEHVIHHVQKQENPGKESKKKKKRDSSTEDATPATAPDIQVKAKKKKKDKKVRKEGKMID